MKAHEEDFADQLGYYLTITGLTQHELANKIGVHRNTIVKWMNRSSRPEARGQVLRLADELSLSKEERKELIQSAGFSVERWPTEIWMVPQQRDPFFIGREDVINSLQSLLQPGSAIGLTQAISGLGGIGKTHTAIEYAFRFSGYYEAILWLSADSWEVLGSACLKAADELGLPEQREMDLIIEGVQRWLRRHRHWLLILDNVEDPQEILPRFVPTGHQGGVLITTRVNDVEPLAQTHFLSSMTEDEGVLFLLRRTKKLARNGDLKQASTKLNNEALLIWQEMEGLPLALDQAGAYIHETGCSFFDYRELFTSRRAALLQRRGKRFIGHEASVATTFSLAFEKIKSLNSVSADILRACSFFQSEAIPEELFEKGAEHLGLQIAPSRYNWDLAMGVLQDYSLVHRNADVKTLAVHRLVQIVLQDSMQPAEQEEWIKRISSALDKTFPQIESTTTTCSQCDRLILHILACTSHPKSLKIISSDLASLLFKTAWFLYLRAEFTQAEKFFNRALQNWEQVFGAESLHVASALNGLATLGVLQDQYAKSEQYFLRALRIYEQNPDSQLPDIASLLTNLAVLYSDTGLYTEAEQYFLRAIRIRTNLSMIEDTTLASLFTNLAILYRDTGQFTKAESLFPYAYSIFAQILGTAHVATALPLSGLANLYFQQGEYQDAEMLCLRALQLRREQLGPEHPDVAASLDNLADLYLKQGKDEQAVKFYREALLIFEKALGQHHSKTIQIREDYIILSRKMGRSDEDDLFG